jgi:G3E family GTPase
MEAHTPESSPSPVPTRRLPVRLHLVGGFLGSGKTTLLRRLLQEGRYGEKVVVLVNEFGDVGIDGALLRKGGNEVVELSNGCVCCQIGKDMLRSVFEMIRAYDPERIVIELTGVAEPGRVLSSLTYSSELMEKARLEPTICVVDCYSFPDLSQEMEYFFYCQAQAADIVLLNKVDLVDADRVELVKEAVRASSPRAFFFPTSYCAVDLSTIFASTDGPGPTPASCGHPHPEGETCEAVPKPLFDSFVWRDPDLVFDRQRVEEWVDGLPPRLFRMKGTMRLAEGDFFINWVRGSLTWEPAAPEDPPPTSLVFIGQGISSSDFDDALRACKRLRARGLRLTGQPR